MPSGTKEDTRSFIKQYKDAKKLVAGSTSPKGYKGPISRLRKALKSKKNKSLLTQYGSNAGNSRAFNTEYKASGGNVASYYGKGGKVAGCGPAQNKK
jgi:hypothetical protein